MTALMHASMRGHTQVVQCLLEAEADPHLKDARGWTALMHATRIYAGRPEMIALLIESGADVNARHKVRRYRSEQCVLLRPREGRGNVARSGCRRQHERHGRMDTAAAVRAANGHTPVVKLLIAAGADIRATDRTGRTALGRCIRWRPCNRRRTSFSRQPPISPRPSILPFAADNLDDRGGDVSVPWSETRAAAHAAGSQSGQFAVAVQWPQQSPRFSAQQANTAFPAQKPQALQAARSIPVSSVVLHARSTGTCSELVRQRCDP